MGSPIVRCVIAGSRAALPIGPADPVIEYVLRVVKQVRSQLTEAGLRIAFEIHKDLQAWEYRQLIEAAGPALVGTYLDTGNPIFVMENPMTTLEELGRYVVGRDPFQILLVEDDNGVRRFASRVLEAAGFKVLTAHDGASALETARTAAVQLLLTDVVMPGMSGPEVAARLSAAQPELRILYMSGHTDKGIVRDGVLQAGVEFLAKPFTSESPVAAVDAAMADPQMDATDRGEVR